MNDPVAEIVDSVRDFMLDALARDKAVVTVLGFLMRALVLKGTISLADAREVLDASADIDPSKQMEKLTAVLLTMVNAPQPSSPDGGEVVRFPRPA